MQTKVEQQQHTHANTDTDRKWDGESESERARLGSFSHFSSFVNFVCVCAHKRVRNPYCKYNGRNVITQKIHHYLFSEHINSRKWH